MAIAPEVLAEYSSLTDAGAAAGAGTLRQAEANVAGRQAAASTALAPRPQRSSQRGGSSSGGTATAAYGAVSSPSAATQTITRLVWAVALGLIVLEIASQATGQFWSFNLQGPGLQKQPYQPLYGPRQTAAALPGMLGGTPGLKLAPGTGGQ